MNAWGTGCCVPSTAAALPYKGLLMFKVCVAVGRLLQGLGRQEGDSVLGVCHQGVFDKRSPNTGKEADAQATL